MIKTGDGDVINLNDVIFGFSMQFVVNNGVDQTVHETYFDKENVK